MTPELKKKIQDCMKKTLAVAVARNGNKELSRDQLMQMLPILWKALETEKLIDDIKSKGFGYAQFVTIAQQQRNKAEFMEKLNIDFNVIFRGK